MTVRVTEVGTLMANLRWEKDDDPRGWLFQALSGDAPLEDVLQAIADPMEFADTSRLDGADDAKRRLRSVLWALKLLTDRADVLTVALKDSYGQSWTEIQEVLDPDNPQARSTARRRYDAGRKRISFFPAPADRPLPGGFTTGQRVRITAVPEGLTADYIGREGVIEGYDADARLYIVTGLSGKTRQKIMGVPGFEADHIKALDDDQDAGEQSS
ncbi:hypothetical protein [Streptomyces sp. BPTC-684]|uniref:hypothetical protein n=1 Tax=Streptomyces sp. BPTC-684 TaxID=3043734 RepID=UPI0024B1AA64|nr:hypothetical protein [Streptomyces sp. BPTC-684]WHM41101.1 hypothetical protein QIY60_32425 [Streptomyces sp. BPTC-684]